MPCIASARYIWRLPHQWIVPGENPNVTNAGIIPDGPSVWGVALEGNLVLASDMNSGLYVLHLQR
jgi:hypothetical protein